MKGLSPLSKTAFIILGIYAALFSKDFVMTPSDFPVLGELDPVLIDKIYESNSDKEASYATTRNNAMLKGLIEKYNLVLLGGPMLGKMSDSGASVWLRTTSPLDVQVKVFDIDSAEEVTSSQVVTTADQGDLTAVLDFTGLQPNTEYRYEVYAGGNKVTVESHLSFTTYPAAKSPTNFSIIFGAGARYQPQNERMWNTLEALNPLALLMLGDNVYIDSANVRNKQRVHYYRRQLRPEFVNLTSTTPTYAIWDDHDFCNDDCGGGENYEDFNTDWKLKTWNVFKENWVNPSYGGGDANPGVYFDLSIGQVDFFLLDSRYYRNKGVSSPSMLGQVQKDWLLDKLKKSTAVFKVIVSPVPLARGVKIKNGKVNTDPWDGYQDEREEIFDFMADNNIGGVFTLASDRHRSDIWKITRSSGYDLYEFMSSAFTNEHTHDLIENDDVVFGFTGTPSLGLVHFNFDDLDAPFVTFDIRDIDNKKIYTHDVQRLDLGSYTYIPPVGTNKGFKPKGNSKIEVSFNKNKQLQIQISPEHYTDVTKGQMKINIFSTDGKIIASSELPFQNAKSIYNVPVPNITAGVYLVEVGDKRFKSVFME